MTGFPMPGHIYRNIHLIVSGIFEYLVGFLDFYIHSKEKSKIREVIFIILIFKDYVILAGVHIIFIITYHIITYMFGGVIRDKIQLTIN